MDAPEPAGDLSDELPKRERSTSSLPSRRVSVSAHFHKVNYLSEGPLTGWRKQVVTICAGGWMTTFMASVILIDLMATMWDIDARASNGSTPVAALVISEICLAIYTFELAALFAAKRWQVLREGAILFDIFTVLCGFAATIVRTMNLPEGYEFLYDLKVFRAVRILRVARILRKTRSVKELQKLVMMMATCLKALAWSFLFCFGFMTLWAMLLVEFVHPIIEQLHQKGVDFEGCQDCRFAAATVMRANLLLFKTVIAGDSWGQIAVPVIEQYPATAIIFCGSLLTLIFGVLNMVIAVVVDGFAESRQRDVLNLAEELEYEDANDKRKLEGMFHRLDKSESGNLTLQELVQGAQRDAEFQSRLRVMDIDADDLEQFFRMIDADDSGSIEREEFVAPLSRWIHDSKTAPRFVKYNVDRLLSLQMNMLSQSEQQFQRLEAQLQELSKEILPCKPCKARASLHAASEDASLSSRSVQCEAVEQPPEARKPHLGFKALNDLRKSNSLVAVALRP